MKSVVNSFIIGISFYTINIRLQANLILSTLAHYKVCVHKTKHCGKSYHFYDEETSYCKQACIHCVGIAGGLGYLLIWSASIGWSAL